MFIDRFDSWSTQNNDILDSNSKRDTRHNKIQHNGKQSLSRVSILMNAIMLNVIVLNIVMLRVLAPFEGH